MPTQAQTLTFHWNPAANTVTIPGGSGSGTETLPLRTLFARHALHYDAFAPSYGLARRRALAFLAPAAEGGGGGGGCPVCMDDDAAAQVLFRCAHALCTSCTAALAAAAGGAFTCPLCRAVVAEVADVLAGGAGSCVVRYLPEVWGALVWRPVSGCGVVAVRVGGAGVCVARGGVGVHAGEGGGPGGMEVAAWVLVGVVAVVAGGEGVWRV